MNKIALAVGALALSVAALAAVLCFGPREHAQGTGAEKPTSDKEGDPHPDREAVAALVKLTGARAGELAQAIRGVSAYPRRTREAILDVAQYSLKHRTLLADLARLRTEPDGDVDRALTTGGYEPDLQRAAALVLVEAPDTIDKMRERPELVRVVGEAWAAPPGRVLISGLLDAAAASQEKTRDVAADRWAGRLKADPKLKEQYIHLLRDYTHRVHADEHRDETLKSYHYGTYLTKDGAVVEDVPSPEVVNYALAVGPQYQAVAAALIRQYLDGANQDDYNAAVGGWYAANGESIPQSARQENSDYYALLQELAQLANTLASNASGTSTGSDGGTSTGSDGGTSSGSDGSGTSAYGGAVGVNSYGDSYQVGAAGTAASRLLAANAERFPKLADWAAKNPPPRGLPTDFTRLKPPFEPKELPKLPFEPPQGAPRQPFSDLMKATGPGERARTLPQAAANPFHVAGLPKAMPNPPASGSPQQVLRGAPSLGSQLSRAPMRMGGAWSPPRGPAPRVPIKK